MAKRRWTPDHEPPERSPGDLHRYRHDDKATGGVDVELASEGSAGA